MAEPLRLTPESQIPLLGVVGGYPEIHVRLTTDAKKIMSIPTGTSGGSNSLVSLPDCRVAVPELRHRSCCIGLYDLLSRQPNGVLAGHFNRILTLVPLGKTPELLQSGNFLLGSAGCDLSIRIWSVTGFCERVRLEGHVDYITGLTEVSPVKIPSLESVGVDGGGGGGPQMPHLASSSLDRSVRLWDYSRGIDLLNLRRAHGEAPINGLKRDLGGRVVYSLGGDSTVRVWDLERVHSRSSVGKTSRAQAVLGNSRKWGSPTSLTPVRGRPCIVVGDENGSVAMWDLRIPTFPVRRIRVHEGEVTDVVGVAKNFFITCGADQCVTMWSWAQEKAERTGRALKQKKKRDMDDVELEGLKGKCSWVLEMDGANHALCSLGQRMDLTPCWQHAYEDSLAVLDEQDGRIAKILAMRHVLSLTLRSEEEQWSLPKHVFVGSAVEDLADIEVHDLSENIAELSNWTLLAMMLGAPTVRMQAERSFQYYLFFMSLGLRDHAYLVCQELKVCAASPDVLLRLLESSMESYQPEDLVKSSVGDVEFTVPFFNALYTLLVVFSGRIRENAPLLEIYERSGAPGRWLSDFKPGLRPLHAHEGFGLRAVPESWSALAALNRATLLREMSFSNVTLITSDGVGIDAHLDVLMFRSQYICELMEDEDVYAEWRRSGRLAVPDISSEFVQEFLYCLYTDQLTAGNMKALFLLWEYARKVGSAFVESVSFLRIREVTAEVEMEHEFARLLLPVGDALLAQEVERLLVPFWLEYSCMKDPWKLDLLLERAVNSEKVHRLWSKSLTELEEDGDGGMRGRLLDVGRQLRGFEARLQGVEESVAKILQQLQQLNDA